jgi:hypothetical protein
LNGWYQPFDGLLSQIGGIRNKPNFKDNLTALIANFSNEMFDELYEVYETM